MTKLKAAVFDWAGTVIDFGSTAPALALVETFAVFGIAVTLEQARAPMGLAKRDHIRAVLEMTEIAEQWRSVKGIAANESDIDALYSVFVRRTVTAAAARAEPIPGAVDAIAELRARGLKIGSTTGYTRAIMAAVAPAAAAHGYQPDNMVCADDLTVGRPAPLGMYQCFVDLGIWPAAAVVKVDDTAPGIEEGIASGCLTVGVTDSGNAMGLTGEEYAAADRDLILERREAAGRMLVKAGAHHVVETIADLPALLAELELV